MLWDVIRVPSNFLSPLPDKVTFDEFVDICGKERPTTEDELMKAFKKIDVNGDGYITNAELHKTLTTVGA